MNNDKILVYLICIIVLLILIGKELHNFYCKNFCKKNKNIIETNINNTTIHIVYNNILSLFI